MTPYVHLRLGLVAHAHLAHADASLRRRRCSTMLCSSCRAACHRSLRRDPTLASAVSGVPMARRQRDARVPTGGGHCAAWAAARGHQAGPRDRHRRHGTRHDPARASLLVEPPLALHRSTAKRTRFLFCSRGPPSQRAFALTARACSGVLSQGFLRDQITTTEVNMARVSTSATTLKHNKQISYSGQQAVRKFREAHEGMPRPASCKR